MQDVPTVMLVALMFVSIVSMSIVTIISSLATMIVQSSKMKRDSLHTSWLIYLLIAHLALFWSTLDIGVIADWQFGEFLLVILGPILAFFAVNTIVPGAAEDPTGSLREHYFRAARKFFGIFAWVKGWGLAMEWMLGHGWTAFSWINALMFLVMISMAYSRATKLHIAGTIIAWVALLASLILRGAYQISPN